MGSFAVWDGDWSGSGDGSGACRNWVRFVLGAHFCRAAGLRRVVRRADSVRSFKKGAGVWGGEFGSFLEIASHLSEERHRAKYRKGKYVLGPLEKTSFFE
jgi:hypothetical protein